MLVRDRYMFQHNHAPKQRHETSKRKEKTRRNSAMVMSYGNRCRVRSMLVPIVPSLDLMEAEGEISP